jgi:hypothetical protein
MIGSVNRLTERTPGLGHLSGLVAVDRFHLFYLSISIGCLRLMLSSLSSLPTEVSLLPLIDVSLLEASDI